MSTASSKRKAARAAEKSGRASKKRAPVSSAPFSADERAQAHALLRQAQELLRAYEIDIDDAVLGADKRADLRADLRFVSEFVERAGGGKLFDRNRRWSLLYFLTKEARKDGQRPNAADLASWPVLPSIYAAESRDAVRARELLAKSIAARTRFEWLEHLVNGIAELEADAMGHREWSPEAFEVTVLAHAREERRVLGVSDDS